jgi:hypothetical protein
MIPIKKMVLASILVRKPKNGFDKAFLNLGTGYCGGALLLVEDSYIPEKEPAASNKGNALVSM